MRFALSAEQEDLRSVAAQLLTDRVTADTVRAGSVAARGIMDDLAELGATGLLIDDESGGLGLDENYLVPIMIEVGRSAAPLPIAETLAIGPLAIPDRAEELAAGSLVVTADPERTGRVRFASVADVAVVGGFGGAGTVTVLDLAGADRSAVAAVDPVADLATVTGGCVIAEFDDPDAVRQIWRRGVLASAAELIGLSRRMLDITVAYVAERRQFGAPIGSFQAVKHHLASALIAVEFAAPTVAAAGALMAAQDDAAEIDRQVATAKSLASDAAHQVSRATLQCHGAIAYTTEYDWQLYAKRAWALAASWGSAAHHRHAVARSLGLTTRDAS